MVERKKTGRAKARKGVSSYPGVLPFGANITVHLGQALIYPTSPDVLHSMHTQLSSSINPLRYLHHALLSGHLQMYIKQP
jgi:hypothetical protein